MPKITIPSHSPLAELCKYPLDAGTIAEIDKLIDHWTEVLNSPNLVESIETTTYWSQSSGIHPTIPMQTKIKPLIQAHIKQLIAIKNEEAKVVHTPERLESVDHRGRKQLAIQEVKDLLSA